MNFLRRLACYYYKPSVLKNLFLFLILTCSIYAQAQDGYVIDNFHIDIKFDEHGKTYITETINVNFTQKRRGIIRKIPTSGKFKGHSQTIWLENIHVADHRFSVSQGSEYVVKIGKENKFLTGKQQYVISYTAGNGLLNFENHEEFYWNLFGSEWDTDIRNSTFSITLPKDIEMSEDDFHVFSGRENSNTEYGSIEKLGRKISGKGLITLGKGKALSVGIKFPKGYFFKQETVENSNQEEVQVEPISIFETDKSFPLPILLAFGFLFSFFKWGRNKKYKTTESRYYPPNEMSPAEVGTYYDYLVNNRDLLSLIPYWGERGLLKVRIDTGTKHHEIFLEKQMEIAIDAPEHEKFFFESIFETSDIVYVDDLKNELIKEVSIAKQKLKSEILDKELYDQEAVKTFHSWPMIILVLLCFILGGTSIAAYEWILTGIGFFLLGMILLFVRFTAPKRSRKGELLHNQLVEFKNTVRAPNDSDLVSIAAKDPRYFDKIFPYAVAFGLDKGWLKSFKDIGVTPDWYYYNDGRAFSYNDFSNDFNLKKIQNKMMTPPQASSGSSSFSGGGSAGGGFGGGGGSSW